MYETMRKRALGIGAICLLLSGLGISAFARDVDAVRDDLASIGLIDVPAHIIETLATFEKIDDYPIYTMRYVGPYMRSTEFISGSARWERPSHLAIDWACSLFAALGDPEQPVFGRNFDWDHSPLLVMFLEPEEGHRSIMSVDIAYLIRPDIIDRLDEMPAGELLPLLSAPFLTFDGMNEKGLAIGMASVDYECGYPSDPTKRDVGDLRLMREVLEVAATVEEAVAFLEGINPVSQGGPNTHYLVADTTPAAALIEYHDGEIVVFRDGEEAPWQVGTNFPVVLAGDEPSGRCWRYDRIERTLREHGGALTSQQAMDLLAAVSTGMTQWSIVYDLADRSMRLSVRRQYDDVVTRALAERAESSQAQGQGGGS